MESHVSLFHKEMKFVLLPAIGKLLQKTGVGSIDWAQDIVVEVRAFGQGRIMGCLVTEGRICASTSMEKIATKLSIFHRSWNR